MPIFRLPTGSKRRSDFLQAVFNLPTPKLEDGTLNALGDFYMRNSELRDVPFIQFLRAPAMYARSVGALHDLYAIEREIPNDDYRRLLPRQRRAAAFINR